MSLRLIVAHALILLALPLEAQVARVRRADLQSIDEIDATPVRTPSVNTIVADLRRQVAGRLDARTMRTVPPGSTLASPATLSVANPTWGGLTAQRAHLFAFDAVYEPSGLTVRHGAGSVGVLYRLPPGDYIARFDFKVVLRGSVTVTHNRGLDEDPPFDCALQDEADTAHCSLVFTVPDGATGPGAVRLEVSETARVRVRSVTLVRSPL